MYLLDGKVGNYLKSSVLDIHGVEQISDVYGRVSEDRTNILLGTQRPMKDVTTLSLSLTYDDTNVSLDEIKTTIDGSDITILSNEPGLRTLFITFDSPKILDGESDFLSIDITKNKTGTAYLNVLNANFRDIEENEFLLSTSGIMF